MMRIPLARLQNLAFGLALLLVVALGVQQMRAQDSLLRANASVEHSLRVVTAVQGTLSALQDVETGMRGFVITGEPAFLAPYEDGRRDVNARVAELRALLGGEGVAMPPELDEAIERRLELAAANVHARRVQGAAVAAERVRRAGGREAMERVRTLLAALENAERDRLQRRHAHAANKVKQARRFAMGGSLAAFALLAMALFSLRRSLRQRQQLTREAQASAARQGALLRAVPDRLWLIPERGPVQPLSSTDSGTLLPPGLEAALRTAAGKVESAGGVQAFEWSTADGGEYDVRVVAADQDHLAIVRDVTESARIRREIRDQREFLRTIVDTDENLIAVRDAQGRFTLCNVPFSDLLLLDPLQMEGAMPADVPRAGLLTPLLEGDDRVMAGEAEWRAERVAVTDAVGAVRWLRVLKRPFVLSNGERQVLTVAVDLSERMRVEQMKSEFISTVSHELRTPLTSIRGALGMLAGGLAGEIPATATPLLDIASKNTERLVRLINDILDIEKLEAGHLQLNLQPLLLRALIEQAVEQIRPYAREYRVDVALHAPDDGEASVDPDRFAQVMANLLSNAIKHSPPEAVVDVLLSRVDGELEIAVKNDGEGIPEAFHPHVFERFAQADGSNVRRTGGSGLGLAITRSLVERMGGRVGFESSAGRGARFHVCLPEVARQAAATPMETAAAARVVLFAGDDAPARELPPLLARQGCRVDVAHDAAQARELLARSGTHALMVDLATTGEAGTALLREIRRQPRYRHLPVLLLGVQGEADGAGLRGGAVAVVDWLDKPLDPAGLADAVNARLRGRGGAPTVLHVEDDPDVRELLRGLLPAGIGLQGAGSLAEARTALAARAHELVILDLMLPDGDGADLLPELGAARPPVPVIIFSALDPGAGECRHVLRHLVKSRTDAEQLATLIMDNLRHWPADGLGNGQRDD